jgi:aminoglycoside phosphotransferase (APT) family kinase protein
MPMLEQHEVAGYLLKRRLLGRRSIAAGALRISDASSRNRNFRVAGGAPGESYLVKQGIVADSAHTLANEAALYRRLTRGGAALRACVPRLHGYDAAGGVLILEWIADGEDLDRVVASRGGCPPVLAAALGRALAALHAVARDGEELRCDAPWVLALHRPPLEALRYLSAASVELVKRLQADAPLCRALDELREGWEAVALVHRDVKWANGIAHPAPGGGARLTRVKLVDWEMAGWGDPAFDVGSAFSDFAAYGLRPGADATRPARVAFWRAYAGTRGLGEGAAAQLLERSARYAGARLVQSAYEHTQETTVMSAHVVRVMALAHELVVPGGRDAAQLLGLRA